MIKIKNNEAVSLASPQPEPEPAMHHLTTSQGDTDD